MIRSMVYMLAYTDTSTLFCTNLPPPSLWATKTAHKLRYIHVRHWVVAAVRSDSASKTNIQTPTSEQTVDKTPSHLSTVLAMSWSGRGTWPCDGRRLAVSALLDRLYRPQNRDRRQHGPARFDPKRFRSPLALVEIRRNKTGALTGYRRTVDQHCTFSWGSGEAYRHARQHSAQVLCIYEVTTNLRPR